MLPQVSTEVIQAVRYCRHPTVPTRSQSYLAIPQRRLQLTERFTKAQQLHTGVYGHSGKTPKASCLRQDVSGF